LGDASFVRYQAILAMILCLTVAPGLRAAEWAERMFETKTYDFGRVPFGAKAEYEFVLNNVNTFDVEIARTRVSCECTEPKVEKPLLKPGERGTITVSLATTKYNGRKGATITVAFNKPAYAEVQLHVTSFIDRAVEITPPSIELGSVERGTAVEKEITVSNTGNPNWRVVEVRSANPHLAGRATETARSSTGVTYRLHARLDASAPGGYFKDLLVLATNDTEAAEVPVLVQGQILADLSVSPTLLSMGTTAPGKPLSKVFVLRAKKPFRIVAVSCDAPGFAFFGSGAQQSRTVQTITATFTPGNRPGKVAGTIHVQTDLAGADCSLPVQAVVAP
jgi:hypothetical protein